MKNKKGDSKFLLKNKKGAELTIGTIVIIVLALVVLVVLILGFTSGWGNLWGRITSFFGGGNNVDSVVQACSVVCSTNSMNDFCVIDRTLRVNKDDPKGLEATGGIEGVTGKESKVVTGKFVEVKGTCNEFGKDTNYQVMGFESCGDLCA